jgi:hypothetical protein
MRKNQCEGIVNDGLESDQLQVMRDLIYINIKQRTRSM